MNDKKYFSVRLFWRSFMQLRIVGGIATVLLAFISVFAVFSSRMELESRMRMDPTYNPRTILLDSIGGHEYMVVMFMIVTPLLALNLWKFLNKRNTSDFYHSLPYTRTCMYVSKTAALISWLIVIFTAVYIAYGISVAANARYYKADMGMLFRFFLMLFICCILVQSAIALACSLTGNMFNNVCVTGFILFLPRIYVKLITTVISQMVYVVSDDKAFSLIRSGQNIVMDYLFAFDYNSDLTTLTYSVTANAYTLILGLIYMVAAYVFFVNRKSEGAGRAAAGKGMRLVLRSVIGYVCATIGAISFVASIRTINTADDPQMVRMTATVSVVVAFVGAALLVIAYDFFSSRYHFRFRNCIPSIVLSWVLAGITAIGVNLTADGILNYMPDKDDIDYVYLTQADNGSYYGGYSEYADYYAMIGENVRIDDERIRDVIAAALKDNIKSVKEGTYDKYNSYKYYDKQKYDGIGSHEYETYTKYEVYIKDGLLGNYRTIYLNEEQNALIATNLKNNEEYKNAYYDLPSYEDCNISWICFEADDKKERIVYETFVEELKGIDFEDYYNYILDRDAGSFNRVNIRFTRKGIRYSIDMYINEKMFPKTISCMYEINNSEVLNKYGNYVNHLQGVFEDLAKDGAYDAEDNIVINMFLYGKDGSIGVMPIDELISLEESELILDTVNTALKNNTEIVYRKGAEYIRLYYANYSDIKKGASFYYYVQIPENITFDWDAVGDSLY